MNDEQRIQRLQQHLSHSSLDDMQTFDVLCALKSLYITHGERDEAYSIARRLIKDVSEYLDDIKNKRVRNKCMSILESAYVTLARDDFHAYLMALEWRREPEKRFYLPRISVMKPIADAWTDMFVHDKYDLMLFSMPPGTGKLLADDTPVLTTNGWKRHGDLCVGDKVFDACGEAVTVLAVGEPDYADMAVKFTNGQTIVCHKRHEWVVVDKVAFGYVTKIKETQDILRELRCFRAEPIEVLNRWHVGKHEPLMGVCIGGIEQVTPVKGRCIQVEGGIYLAGETLIPTHNSTLGIFGCSWVGWRDPENCNLMSGYAEKITKSFYSELNSLFIDPDYNTHKIFPRLELVSQSAKDYTMDFTDTGRIATKRFQTFTARPIDGSLTGATRCENLLYVDDLVKGIEEALNPMRLDTLWDKYTNDLASRKKKRCKEIHIGTRWSVHDPIGRLEDMYGYSRRTHIIKTPALDKDGNSLFDYPYDVGFSTENYEQQRKKMDDLSWKSLYMQQPLEREGLLFPEDELSFFYGFDEDFMKDNPPDDVFSFVDVAFGGDDYLSMPILAQWGDEPPYVIDWLFSKGNYKTTEPLVKGYILKHKLRRVTFEANNGGDFYARDIIDMLEEDASGHKVFISTQRSLRDKSKLARIVQHSPVIKEMKYLDRSKSNRMYKEALHNLTTFTQTGKVQHDDAPDSLAGAATMLRSLAVAKVATLDKRPVCL